MVIVDVRSSAPGGVTQTQSFGRFNARSLPHARHQSWTADGVLRGTTTGTDPAAEPQHQRMISFDVRQVFHVAGRTRARRCAARRSAAPVVFVHQRDRCVLPACRYAIDVIETALGLVIKLIKDFIV